jgi:hypothetical protein
MNSNHVLCVNHRNPTVALGRASYEEILINRYVWDREFANGSNLHKIDILRLCYTEQVGQNGAG